MLLYEKHAEDFRISRAHNWDFIPHAHHNLEILVCTSGEFGVSCCGQVRVLKPGEMMIAFSHDIHAYVKTGEGTGVMMIINPNVLPLLAGKLAERRYENFFCGEREFCVSVAEAILKEYDGDRSREILVGYLYVLLGSALRELPWVPRKSEISNDLFSRVMEYLSENYTQRISLKSLSRNFGVDPCHLSRMFSERLSYGFLKYLHMLRVEHAKNLLRNSRLKMSEVLVQSGFSDQKTFNRVFREVTGVTPTEYRNSEKSGAV